MSVWTSFITTPWLRAAQADKLIPTRGRTRTERQRGWSMPVSANVGCPLVHQSGIWLVPTIEGGSVDKAGSVFNNGVQLLHEVFPVSRRVGPGACLGVNDDAIGLAVGLGILEHRHLEPARSAGVHVGLEGEQVWPCFLNLRNRVVDLASVASPTAVLELDGMRGGVVDDFF